MRDVVHQRKEEGVFAAHQHQGVFFVARPAVLQEAVQEVLVDVGVGCDGLDLTSEVDAICGSIGEGFGVGSSDGPLLGPEGG